MGSLGLWGGIAYHLDGALTVVVDVVLSELAGVDDAGNSKSLSICVPLICLETSVPDLENDRPRTFASSFQLYPTSTELITEPST